MYPLPLEQLIRAFRRLPSVGQRTAERFVFHLLKAGKKDVAELISSLTNVMNSIKSCEVCWDFSDTSPCTICADRKRDQHILCVVREPQDLRAIERTGSFGGRYHILRGTLNPDRDAIAGHTKIAELIARIKTEHITEIILALNPDLPGETTAMFIEKKCKELYPKLTTTRLARGLPMGSDLQYADEITLGSALKYRVRQ